MMPSLHIRREKQMHFLQLCQTEGQALHQASLGVVFVSLISSTNGYITSKKRGVENCSGEEWFVI
jgi:hypothetical protein